MFNEQHMGADMKGQTKSVMETIEGFIEAFVAIVMSAALAIALIGGTLFAIIWAIKHMWQAA